MLADGELTAPDLLEIYLERIARLDSELRSYRVVLTDKARDEAYVAQDRLDAGERLALLGKTSVPELMIMPFTESLAWGATRNPWNPNRTPGGSSGGSAAAVAAGLAPAAPGSHGGGSRR